MRQALLALLLVLLLSRIVRDSVDHGLRVADALAVVGYFVNAGWIGMVM